jgi:hypothetical protein
MAIIGYLLSCVFIHWYKLDESLYATILESIAVVEFLLGTLFVDSAVRYFSLLFYRKVTIFMLTELLTFFKVLTVLTGVNRGVNTTC